MGRGRTQRARRLLPGPAPDPAGLPPSPPSRRRRRSGADILPTCGRVARDGRRSCRTRRWRDVRGASRAKSNTPRRRDTREPPASRRERGAEPAMPEAGHHRPNRPIAPTIASSKRSSGEFRRSMNRSRRRSLACRRRRRRTPMRRSLMATRRKSLGDSASEIDGAPLSVTTDRRRRNRRPGPTAMVRRSSAESSSDMGREQHGSPGEFASFHSTHARRWRVSDDRRSKRLSTKSSHRSTFENADSTPVGAETRHGVHRHVGHGEHASVVENAEPGGAPEFDLLDELLPPFMRHDGEQEREAGDPR